MAKSARWCPPELSRCCATHSGFFEGLLFFSCCLAHASSARCLVSSRPDTASIRSCLLCHRDSLTRGRLAFAQESVRLSSLSPRLVLHVMACSRRRSCSYVKMFLDSSTFDVSAPFSTVYSRYAWACSKSTTSCCVEDLPPLLITIRRTFSNTVSLCRVFFFFLQRRASHFAISSSCEESLSLCVDSFPCQVGFVNGHFVDPGRSLIQEGLFGKMVFFVNAISERFLSENQGDVIPETPKVSLIVPSSPWGSSEKRGHSLFSGMYRGTTASIAATTYM